MFLTSQDDRLLRGYGAIGPIVTGVTRGMGRRSRWIGRVTGLTDVWIGLIGRERSRAAIVILASRASGGIGRRARFRSV